MKTGKSFGTLESRIYAIFTLMVFITIFIMQLFSFRFTINTVRKSMLHSGTSMLQELVDQIDTYIVGMEQPFLLLVNDPEIHRFLRESDAGRVGDYSGIQSRMSHYIQARTDISNILLADMAGHVVSGNPENEINPWTVAAEKPWFVRALEADEETVVSSSYVQNMIAGKYSWVVSLSRVIQSGPGGDEGKDLGVLLFDLKFNRIKELCQSLVIGGQGYNFIVDGSGNYVYYPTQQLIYSNVKSEPLENILESTGLRDESHYFYDGRYYMSATSPRTGWRLVGVVDEGDITPDWRSALLTYSLIGLVLFLIVGLSTNRISMGITNPIRQLKDIMKSVETGDFITVGRIEATEEIRELAREYDIMVGRIEQLMEAHSLEQELKRKSDLKALQAQINPHFLYNTLDSIIWMSEMKQDREVVRMTSALSKLFRISISKGWELIPIRDEIAHVESYLTIQGMRYRDKFGYRIAVDPSLYDKMTLKILLQPLVENAIYHGIKETDYKGLIEITGTGEGDAIVFEVRDNGRGMSPEKLAELRREIEVPPLEGRTSGTRGFGVRNVQERIQLYFGSGYGLSCASEAGRGTLFTVRLPLSPPEDTA